MDDTSNLSTPEKVEKEISNLKNIVTLINDNNHTYEQVINQIMLAINCNESDAFRIAYITDIRGSCNVYKGDMADCVRISSILESIGLITKIKFV